MRRLHLALAAVGLAGMFIGGATAAPKERTPVIQPLMVWDATGKAVGRYRGDQAVQMTLSSGPVAIGIEPGNADGSKAVFSYSVIAFTQPDCTGQAVTNPFVGDNPSRFGTRPGVVVLDGTGRQWVYLLAGEFIQIPALSALQTQHRPVPNGTFSRCTNFTGPSTESGMPVVGPPVLLPELYSSPFTVD